MLHTDAYRWIYQKREAQGKRTALVQEREAQGKRAALVQESLQGMCVSVQTGQLPPYIMYPTSAGAAD